MSTLNNSEKIIGNKQINEEKYIFIKKRNKYDNLNICFSDRYKILLFIIFIFLFLLLLIITNYNNKKNIDILKFKVYLKENEIKVLNKKLNKKVKFNFNFFHSILIKEKDMPHLREINLKRTFEKRIPLPKEIKCKPHLVNEELLGFLSLLTEDTIYFETGSGCSSIIAKYFAKKTYAVEGCKTFYELGLKNGLKDVLIFKDLKPDSPIWSHPGKKSKLKDWKKYFQAYKAEYNADVILIDGRFKVATAMDIFDKIRNDTIVLLHEYNSRPVYFVIEEYYQYIYHWDSLYAFVKKPEINYIPLEIQKKYWNEWL